jgi:gluconolactonase
MRTQALSGALAALFGAALVTAQAPSSGPSLQAAADPRYKSVIDTCKTPPPAPAARGGGPAGGGRGAAPAAAPAAGDVTSTAIPGVIAAGQKWTKVWETSGNNADGIVGTPDGGLLIAQNDNAQVLKLDRDGKTSVAYKDTNTGGALSFSPKGALFIVQRGIGTAVWQLAPERKMLANRINGDPLECLGGVINDITADSKGGAYFTMGGLFYADAKGTVTRYGENLRTNGVLLSRDEKTLFVTNGPSVVAFDVQASGALTNQREFVAFPGGGGDGITIDSEGRIYVTGASGLQVAGPDGKYLGLIPTPQGVITAAFSGPDKKTLFAVVSIRRGDARDAQIISIPMLAQGFKGRAK